MDQQSGPPTGLPTHREHDSSRTFGTCCITRGTVSYCPQGGDAGYGGLAFLAITDVGATCMNVEVMSKDGELERFRDARGFAVRMRGDAEAENLVAILEWAAAELRRILAENKGGQS